MADKLQATLTAGFGSASNANSNIGLAIENDYGAFSVDQVHLLLYPAVPATLAVTVGSVSYGNRRSVIVPTGVVTFGGGDTASLPKRGDAVAPMFSVLFAFNTQGQAITVDVQYDADSNVLRASEPCYAVVQFSEYRTFAFELLYIPKITPLAGGGSSSEFGVIAAFYPPDNLTTFQVSAFQFDQGKSVFEMYRIVSDIVTTQDNENGPFEKPPGFPSSGTYPGKTLVIDLQTAMMVERVHEIGLMDALGRVDINTYFRPVLEPYVGDTSYVITKRLVQSTLPDDKQFPKELIAKAKNIVAARGQGKL